MPENFSAGETNAAETARIFQSRRAAAHKTEALNTLTNAVIFTGTGANNEEKSIIKK